MIVDVITGSVAAPTNLGLLPLLLTTEGLLFAALTIGVSLSTSTVFAPKTVVAPAVLACVAASVLLIVAAAAVLAWTDLFLASDWPHGWNGRFEAIALLFAIVAQPLIAILVAVGIWRG